MAALRSKPVCARFQSGAFEAEWMSALRQVALDLQRSLPDDAVKIVLRDAREDLGALAARS